MKSLLGCHWIRTHPDSRDYAHIEAMQYRSVKLFEWHWSDRDACRDLLAVLPHDSYILARDHPLSEQKQDMANDPEGTGVRHANEWALKVAMGQVHVPTDRTFFLGINEPDATTGDRDGIDRYTAAFLTRLKVHGLRGGAFNFSTGHPRTVDGTPNTLADYSVFERSHRSITDGNHIAVLHIYGTAAFPCAPGHYDRLNACTWQDVEWVVGEFGIDEHVIGGGPHDGYQVPFNGHLADYCAWLDTAIMGIADSRIHSYQVFTYDFSHPWDTFDIHPIRDALEAYEWQHMHRLAPMPTPLFVSVPAGANLRFAPGGEILTAIPYGERVSVDSYATATDGKKWARVRYQGFSGWIRSDLLTVDKPQPVHSPAPTAPPQPTDNWQRSIAFVRKWEGGYSDNPDDHGNWTGGRKGHGELKGTKYGVSAASYPQLDIRNLTMAEADAIFFRDYWQASGAASLPWPGCLLAFDTAVLHGVETSREWQQEVGINPYAFAAKRLRVYTKLDNWHVFGVGWVNRVAGLLEEAAR